jgi:hypothetical protein
VVAAGVWYFALRSPLTGRIHFHGRDYLLDDSDCFTKARLDRTDGKKFVPRPWGTFAGHKILIDDLEAEKNQKVSFTPAALYIEKRPGCWIIYDLSGGP